MTISASVSRSATQRLLMLLSAALLCACGQTGALYLPDEPTDQHVSDNAAEPAEPQNKRTPLSHD
jgi:predicted small lipoprotein YifL